MLTQASGVNFHKSSHESFPRIIPEDRVAKLIQNKKARIKSAGRLIPVVPGTRERIRSARPGLPRSNLNHRLIQRQFSNE